MRNYQNRYFDFLFKISFFKWTFFTRLCKQELTEGNFLENLTTESLPHEGETGAETMGAEISRYLTAEDGS